MYACILLCGNPCVYVLSVSLPLSCVVAYIILCGSLYCNFMPSTLSKILL